MVLLKLVPLTNLIDFSDICLIICQSAVRSRDDGGRLFMLAAEKYYADFILMRLFQSRILYEFYLDIIRTC